MEYDEIKGTVTSIFENNCPYLEDNFDDKMLSDIGISSIIFIKIVTQIEDFFNFEFTDEDLDYNKFHYISDVCNYIQSKKQY